jgi:hypothetical protein
LIHSSFRYLAALAAAIFSKATAILAAEAASNISESLMSFDTCNFSSSVSTTAAAGFLYGVGFAELPGFELPMDFGLFTDVGRVGSAELPGFEHAMDSADVGVVGNITSIALLVFSFLKHKNIT